MVTPIFANMLDFFVRKRTGNAKRMFLGDLLIQVLRLQKSKVRQIKTIFGVSNIMIQEDKREIV